MLAKAFVKKLLEPKDVADLAKFLCSETGDYMTGGLIPIDCGWTAS
jgi:3-hydroxybutyrate dehydrogenase